jgi:hypothetical protein
MEIKNEYEYEYNNGQKGASLYGILNLGIV